MPLTSGKIYWLNTWEDLKEPIDYLYQNYCHDGVDELRNLYAYGVSLGGSMLTLYLENEGDRSPLKGACCFGAPYDLKENVPFFKKNGFKFYDFAMGYNYYLNVLSKHLPVL